MVFTRYLKKKEKKKNQLSLVIRFRRNRPGGKEVAGKGEEKKSRGRKNVIPPAREEGEESTIYAVTVLDGAKKECARQGEKKRGKKKDTFSAVSGTKEKRGRKRPLI